MGTPALHKAISNLIKKDLIYKGVDKRYCIVDSFLAEWVGMVSKGKGQFPS
jgi:hypothetical protein